MIFRYARHTKNLKALTDFYTKIIGMQVLGDFEDHAGYNGVFLGFPDADWQLEFTVSDKDPKHYPDRDDLLVFYCRSKEQRHAITAAAKRMSVEAVLPENPYWRKNGVEYLDPDGYGVVVSQKEVLLKSDDIITLKLKEFGVETWDQLLDYVRALPYGRNANRSDLSLVLTEQQGTCSSKHALVKHVADQNGIGDVSLILAIYHMTASNTVGVGDVLTRYNLPFIPEAHCYIKDRGKILDLTNEDSDFSRIERDIIKEQVIPTEQVGQFKVDWHKAYLLEWLSSANSAWSFEEIWKIREACIAALQTDKS